MVSAILLPTLGFLAGMRRGKNGSGALAQLARDFTNHVAADERWQGSIDEKLAGMARDLERLVGKVDAMPTQIMESRHKLANDFAKSIAEVEERVTFLERRGT